MYSAGTGCVGPAVHLQWCCCHISCLVEILNLCLADCLFVLSVYILAEVLQY